MKKISEVTRRDLFNVIQEGFDKRIADGDFPYTRGIPAIEKTHIYMPFCGHFSEIDFLDRLYHLETMPSTDPRFSNAKGDIFCHRVRFLDWPDYWFLDDDRFELKGGFDDEPLLKFLCEMLHPAVRDDEGPWRDYLDRFNMLLRTDGYEIYASYKISGRDIFKFHDYVRTPNIFDKHMLFTTRYQGLVEMGSGTPVDLICTMVHGEAKDDLVSALEEFAEPGTCHPSRYDSFTIQTDAMYQSLQRLNKYLGYPVIELNGSGMFGNRYIDQLRVIFTPLLFDLIEIQYDELSESEKAPFQDRINGVFRQYDLGFILTMAGMIEKPPKYEVLNNAIGEAIGSIKEVGLRGLLDEALSLHQRPDVASHKDAMEKIWDAFERLKTYYLELDKRASASKIVGDMACGQDAYKNLFDEEFKALTNIGNHFRIRHHETDKIEITDPRYYDYFFNRCLSLIATAILYLN